MRKKGFTLVELLVVIAIIAMLLAILMPALNKVRQIAYRMVCGSNLSGLGKACLTYANDYAESYPVTTGTTTGTALQWKWSNNSADFWDNDVTSTSGGSFNALTSLTQATVSSSQYLLIKYADVSTGQFVCKATDVKKFDLTTTASAYATPTTNTIKDVTQCWDFGGENPQQGGTSGSWNYCSYAYQMPYTSTKANTVKMNLTASTQAGMAIMADASPWFKQGRKNPDIATTYAAGMTKPYMPSSAEWGITGTTGPQKDRIKLANSLSHQQEGQNVLFADSHVSFETQSNVGVQQDNIYVSWVDNNSNAAGKSAEEIQGSQQVISQLADPGPTMGSYNEADNFLVNN
jgi:prepilin-type N-terminal cleavage/methylation domain-containing protein